MCDFEKSEAPSPMTCTKNAKNASKEPGKLTSGDRGMVSLLPRTSE